MPRALIFAPHRRSRVSSRPMITGPSGTKRLTSKRNRQRATRRLGPAISVENPVVVRETWILVEPSDAQRRSDSAAPGTEDSAGDQSQHMLPGRGGEGFAERFHPSSEFELPYPRPHPTPESNREQTRSDRARRESLVRSQGIQRSRTLKRAKVELRPVINSSGAGQDDQRPATDPLWDLVAKERSPD